MYNGLGCPSCAATYEEVFSIMPACYAANSAAECEAAAASATVMAAGSDEESPQWGAYGGFKFDDVSAADFENVKSVEGVALSMATGAGLPVGAAVLGAALGVVATAWML